MNALALVIAVLAFAYFIALPRPQSMPMAILKTAPVALMALFSVMAGQPLYLTLALAFSAAGDAALAFDDQGEKPFFLGVAFFSVAHLAYAALFVFHPEPAAVLPATINIVFAGSMIVAGLITQRFFWPRAGSVRLPLAIYTAIILLMGLCALAYANIIIIIGVLCFMASDTLVGTRRFLLARNGPHQIWTGRVLWALYIAAQALILYGFIRHAASI